MDIKINSHMRYYTGPSENYYNAYNRFESILQYKLGVVEHDEAQSIKSDESDKIGKAIDENNSVNIDKSNPIFPDVDRLSKNQFSDVKPLVKNVASVIINGIIDTNDIRKKSNYTASEINKKLKGTPLDGLGDDFKRAEDLYGVNALVLMAMSKLESNYGRSKIAQDKNNLFGFQAYDSSPYESAKKYDNKQDSIYDVAKHLSKNYLSSGGDYFRGYSINNIGENYSTDPKWSEKVRKIASELTR